GARRHVGEAREGVHRLGDRAVAAALAVGLGDDAGSRGSGTPQHPADRTRRARPRVRHGTPPGEAGGAHASAACAVGPHNGGVDGDGASTVAGDPDDSADSSGAGAPAVAPDGPDDVIDVSVEQAQALVAEQHPDLADRPLTLVAAGWDNLLFRLGDDLALRLPRRAVAAPLIEHEQRWLPELALRLPLPVPVPVRTGGPGCGYPWRWSITPWLPGHPLLLHPPDDAEAAGRQLGAFVAA